MKTLMYMLKNDFSKEYNEIQIEIQKARLDDIGEHINWDLSGEAEFAKKFKQVCFNGSNIVFTGKQTEPQGFLFNGVYWEELSLHGAELLKDKFDQLYQWYCGHLETLKTTLPTDKEDENYKQAHKEFADKVKRVKTINEYSTRIKIIKQFKADCYEKSVEWNRNPDLFVFEDCVYHLAEGKFVEPNPEDYMNISCGKKYNVEIEVGELVKAKEEIENIITSMLLKEDKEFVKKLLSSFLRQGNREELAYFWLGRGRNGKGTLTELIKMVLGYYWGELSMDYYTSHSEGADRPNQNLYNCRNSRALNSTEVDDNTKFKIVAKYIVTLVLLFY
jgi:hypothetical protein